jgi:hypothetical protein
MRQQALARDQARKEASTPLGEQLFDIAIAEGETCTEPNDVLKDR